MTTLTAPTTPEATGSVVNPDSARRRSLRALMTYQRIELLRMLRNPWTIGFALLMPVAMYLLFGAGPEYSSQDVGNGNVAAMVMTSMALFGAITTATNVAGSVADERGNGWNRQLRLTPLSPAQYVISKVANSSLVALFVVGAVFAVGAATGAEMTGRAWVGTLLTAWILGAGVFSAFGLAVGMLFKGEAVLGVAGPLLSLFAFFGGLFIPLDTLGSGLASVAPFTPMYGMRELIEAQITGAAVETAAVVGLVAWTSLFVTVAVVRYRSEAGRPW